ncbi:MAG: leucine-rich repeat domain-containing protein [Clostridiales bacterium]|nr:leucine-rich repeat domain-containing protein [Clostridiales bacterium]
MKKLYTVIIFLMLFGLFFACGFGEDIGNVPDSPLPGGTDFAIPTASPAQEAESKPKKTPKPQPTTEPKYVEEFNAFDLEGDGNDWSVIGGLLTIKSSAGMNDWIQFKEYFESFASIEFSSEVRNKVVSLIINDGVAEIPEAAFDCFNTLQSAILPDGLLLIDAEAFWGCRNLSQINIPSSVREIGVAAFEACNSLNEFIIPNGIVVLRDGFINGVNLIELRIPSSVELIERDALLSCAKRFVFEGTVKEIEHFSVFLTPDFQQDLQQVVFLSGPPEIYLYPLSSGDVQNVGLKNLEYTNCTIYYLSKNAALWAPNGETEWLGRPLIAIDSLDDLPPLHP